MATYTSPFNALKAGSKQEYGLVVSFVDANTISLSPGLIYASDETTPMSVATPITTTMTAMGGSEPTDGLAYPWLGVNAGAAPSFWLDTSPTVPTLTPAGITAKRYIGPALRNDGSQNMALFSSIRAGRSVSVTFPSTNAFLATGNLLAPVAFSLVPFIPATASTVWGRVVGMTNEASAPLYRQTSIWADAAMTHLLGASGTEGGPNEQNWVFGAIGTESVTLSALYYNCSVATFTVAILSLSGFTEAI